jgi:hypothetical protein
MPSFGSAGGIGTPTSSRARMLAQQRDIQQKKRLSAYQSGGNWLSIGLRNWSINYANR